jgi:hypothetical protein
VPSLASPSAETVHGSTAAAAAAATGSTHAPGGATTAAPPRPQPLDNSPGAILFALVVLGFVGLVGWRLRANGRRELVEPREGR